MPGGVLIGGPAPTEARQGRHKQRYGVNGERLVAGCIPVRYTGDGSRAEDVEVLLISSRGGGKGFCFPKGGWEDDETLEYAAKRETVEEAGVRGTLEEPMLGTFPFSSKTSAGIVTRHQGKCIAHIFVMHVAEELEMWPEREERQRFWCPLPDTSANCRYDWMREALAAWVQRKGWVHLLRHRELSAPVLTQQPWEQPALQPPQQTEQAQPSGTPTVAPAVNRAGWSDGSDLGSESVDSSSRPACPSTQSIESTRGTPPPEPTT